MWLVAKVVSTATASAALAGAAAIEAHLPLDGKRCELRHPLDWPSVVQFVSKRACASRRALDTGATASPLFWTKSSSRISDNFQSEMLSICKDKKRPFDIGATKSRAAAIAPVAGNPDAATSVEFERELIRARTGEGRKRAKERGVHALSSA
jgi:hypothetical protein